MMHQQFSQHLMISPTKSRRRTTSYFVSNLNLKQISGLNIYQGDSGVFDLKETFLNTDKKDFTG